jgi:hypothetical protein
MNKAKDAFMNKAKDPFMNKAKDEFVWYKKVVDLTEE